MKCRLETKMFNIQCNSVFVQTRPFGSDIIYIKFEGPPTFPNCEGSKPELIIYVKQGTGTEYVRKVFGVEPDGEYQCD